MGSVAPPQLAEPPASLLIRMVHAGDPGAGRDVIAGCPAVLGVRQSKSSSDRRWPGVDSKTSAHDVMIVYVEHT